MKPIAGIESMSERQIKDFATGLTYMLIAAGVALVVLTCVLFYNMSQLKKYGEIDSGEYLSRTQCDLQCSSQFINGFNVDLNTQDTGVAIVDVSSGG